MKKKNEVIFENRASVILYKFLKNIEKKGVFLLPSNICPIVPLTFLKAEVEYEFLDIELDTYCLDFDLLEDKIRLSKKYIGLIFINSYGIEKNFENKFKKIKDINNEFIIIHDKCLCIPSFEWSKTCVDLILYSTGYGKTVNIGFGGYGIKYNERIKIKEEEYDEFDKKQLYELEESYKKAINRKEKFVYKDSKWLDFKKPKINFFDYKTLVKKELIRTKKKKQSLNSIYNLGLKKDFNNNNNNNVWRYNILIENADEVINRIFAEGLFASRHYSSLSNIFSNTHSPNAEILEDKIVNLFNDFYVNEEYVYKIIEIINNYGRTE